MKFYVRGIARRESSHSTDRKVAEKLLKRRLAEVETKTYIPRTNVKISDERDGLIVDLLAEYRQQGRKSIETAKWRWEKHLKPFFNKLPADDLNTDLVQRYCAKREAERSERRVNQPGAGHSQAGFPSRDETHAAESQSVS